MEGENKENYVIKINNEEIFLPEFSIYLKEAEKDFESIGGSDIWDTNFDGQTAEEAAKESALNGLKMVKISVQQASALGLSLSEEEKSEAKKEAEETYLTYTEEEKQIISLEDVYQVMIDQSLYSKTEQNITQNLVINQEDFEIYFQRSQQDFTNSYTKYILDTIFVTDIELAEEALYRVKNGEDFFILVQEYAQKTGPELSITIFEDYKSNLETSFGIAFDLNEGETSGIMTGEKGFYIFKVREKQTPTEQEVKENAWDYYQRNMKQLLFTQEYQKWAANAKVEKNDVLWSQITIKEK